MVTTTGVRMATAAMMAYCAACEWDSMAWNTTGRALRMARSAGEPAHVTVAAYALQANDRDVPRFEFRDELVGHDAEHHRLEPLSVELVEQAEQMALDTAEGIPLDEVDDPDRVPHACLR